MPDILDRDGLQTKGLPEITTSLADGMRAIFGADINLDQNSPDGQLLNIYAQGAVDIRELLTQIYNGFNPDRAVGRILDERVVINNIVRKGGTFTITPIQIIVDRTVSLAGLDANFNDPEATGFTIQDNAGNQFILIDSETLVAGTYTRSFRAKTLGLVETTVNTITNPVTVVLGVTSLNNPTGPLEIGSNEETDAELRTRRQQSVALASTGYLNGLLGFVLNIDGVTDAALYENVTNVTDANGIPAHGIWLIAEGGANSDIGEAIYERKSYGANMKGAVEVDITTPSGATFTAKFDRPTAAPLYVRFDIKSYAVGNTFDTVKIKQYIVDNLDYKIGQLAETSALTGVARDAIAINGGGGAAINMEISTDGVTYVDYLTTPTLDSQWVLDTTRIAITVV